MTTPPPTPPAPDPDHPRRWRRCGPWLFALLLLGLPVVGLVGLAVLGVRSYRVEEHWTVAYDAGSFDPVMRRHQTVDGEVMVAATDGLLAIEATWWRTSEVVADPDEGQRLLNYYQAIQTQPKNPDDPHGWQFRHWIEKPADTDAGPASQPPVPTDQFITPSQWFQARQPGNSLALPRADSFGHPVTFASWVRLNYLGPRDHVQIVAPFWGWMIPLGVPVAWWLWCPPGRVLPRLTLRRTLVATAGVALLLTLVGRSSPVDLAVLTLGQFNADILYEADPPSSGRLAPVGVCLSQSNNDHQSAITPAHAAQIRRALSQLPTLRTLVLSGNPGPPSIETAMLPPGRADLVVLSLAESNADAATLTRLAEFPHLRRLDLTRSQRIRDADLALLRNLPDLVELRLGHLRTTDAGLDHLRGLPNLRRLDFGPPELWYREPPSALTSPALQRLADSLPNLDELVCPDGTILRPSRPIAASLQPEPQP